MKKLILFFSLIIAAGYCRAQKNDSVGASIPPYRILTTDSTWVTPANLKHEKTLLIYFSPDCPHCQHLTMEMRERMKKFTGTQILMITWSNNYDIRAIKNFVRDFDLKKYPNIVIGTEGYSYFVQKYFKIQTTPYVAIYNRDKKLVKAYAKAPEVNELIATVKKTK